MKKILGYTLMFSPLWLIVAVVIWATGWDSVIAILVTSALVFGTFTLGCKLLE